MVKTAKMIKRHWSGILQWKLSSINNGILESTPALIIFKIWNLSKVILALGRLSLTPLIKAGDMEVK
jgi:hypothetical protein